MSIDKKLDIELDKLAANVDTRAKLPRGFHLFSTKMMIMWLRSHQKKVRA